MRGLVLIAGAVLLLLLVVKESHSFARKHCPQLRAGDFQYANCAHHFCEIVEEYPKKEIEEAMAAEHNPTIFLAGIKLITHNEAHGRSDDERICNVEGLTVYAPKVMKNVAGTYKFIVNVQNYKQTFRAEFCKNNASDDGWTDVSTSKFHCKQNSQELFLLTFHECELQYDKFLVPTTCSAVCL